jgi:hypothetical protein
MALLERESTQAWHVSFLLKCQEMGTECPLDESQRLSTCVIKNSTYMFVKQRRLWDTTTLKHSESSSVLHTAMSFVIPLQNDSFQDRADDSTL